MNREIYLVFALIFAIKSIWMPDWVSALGMLLFLAAVLIWEFFHSKSQEVLFRKRIEDLETLAKETREIQKQMALAQGMRNPRLGVTEQEMPSLRGSSPIMRG